MKILKFIWQLPQNLIGFIITRFSKKKINYLFNDNSNGIIYFNNNFFNSGVSLGNYIILDTVYNENAIQKTANHEHGHQKQSLYLGPLYLLVVGMPSATRNVIDRLFHKKWIYKERVDWYYGGFPENWADKLGNVERS